MAVSGVITLCSAQCGRSVISLRRNIIHMMDTEANAGTNMWPNKANLSIQPRRCFNSVRLSRLRQAIPSPVTPDSCIAVIHLYRFLRPYYLSYLFCERVTGKLFKIGKELNGLCKTSGVERKDTHFRLFAIRVRQDCGVKKIGGDAQKDGTEGDVRFLLRRPRVTPAQLFDSCS